MDVGVVNNAHIPIATQYVEEGIGTMQGESEDEGHTIIDVSIFIRARSLLPHHSQWLAALNVITDTSKLQVTH